MKDETISSFDKNLTDFLDELQTKLHPDYKIPDPQIINIIFKYT
jgi:hypothetical protein